VTFHCERVPISRLLKSALAPGYVAVEQLACSRVGAAEANLQRRLFDFDVGAVQRRPERRSQKCSYEPITDHEVVSQENRVRAGEPANTASSQKPKPPSSAKEVIAGSSGGRCTRGITGRTLR